MSFLDRKGRAILLIVLVFCHEEILGRGDPNEDPR
jgi:hypothetical protein